MGGDLRLVQPEPEDSELVRKIEARAANRRAFREMLKTEIVEHPLTGRRRREFLRFAESLGIDNYEARMLIRAVEYECCVGGSGAGAGSRSATWTLGPPADEESSSWFGLAIALVTALVIGAMLLRALAAFTS
jgi:hypothetical protein